MKLIKFLFVIIPISIFSQELVKCEDNVNYIVKNFNGSFIKIKTTEEVKQLDNPQIFVLNENIIIQLLLNDSKNYKNYGKDDLSVMASYVLSEGEYFSSIFKKKVDLTILPEELNNDKKAIFWSFDIPENANAKIKALKSVFITSINEHVITTIGTTQFENQKIEDIKKQLIELSKNISLSKTKEICK